MATGGSSGIRRKVDDLGRVVIPAGMRRTLNMREGDAVEVSVEGERVVISRPRDACVFCAREDESLESFRNRVVCHDCLGTLGRVDARRRAATADGVPVPDPIPPPTPGPVPEPVPEPVPDPIPDPLPAPLPTPEPDPQPVPARTPVPGTGERTAMLGAVDGDALSRAQGRRTRPHPRSRTSAHAGDPASTTAW